MIITVRYKKPSKRVIDQYYCLARMEFMEIDGIVIQNNCPNADSVIWVKIDK